MRPSTGGTSAPGQERHADQHQISPPPLRCSVAVPGLPLDLVWQRGRPIGLLGPHRRARHLRTSGDRFLDAGGHHDVRSDGAPVHSAAAHGLPGRPVRPPYRTRHGIRPPALSCHRAGYARPDGTAGGVARRRARPAQWQLPDLPDDGDSDAHPQRGAAGALAQRHGDEPGFAAGVAPVRTGTHRSRAAAVRRECRVPREHDLLPRRYRRHPLDTHPVHRRTDPRFADRSEPLGCDAVCMVRPAAPDALYPPGAALFDGDVVRVDAARARARRAGRRERQRQLSDDGRRRGSARRRDGHSRRAKRERPGKAAAGNGHRERGLNAPAGHGGQYGAGAARHCGDGWLSGGIHGDRRGDGAVPRSGRHARQDLRAEPDQYRRNDGRHEPRERLRGRQVRSPERPAGAWSRVHRHRNREPGVSGTMRGIYRGEIDAPDREKEEDSGRRR